MTDDKPLPHWRQVRQKLMRKALARTNNSGAAAAKLIGMGKSAFYREWKKMRDSQNRDTA
jgi:DNA-binding NtrC family response regulator